MAKLTKKEQQQYDKCLAQCTQCFCKPYCELRRKIRELRVLSDAEKLEIAESFLSNAGRQGYTAECERREKDGG